eukprot:5634710-Prorocentrum_lima.AAC.1
MELAQVHMRLDSTQLKGLPWRMPARGSRPRRAKRHHQRVECDKRGTGVAGASWTYPAAWIGRSTPKRISIKRLWQAAIFAGRVLCCYGHAEVLGAPVLLAPRSCADPAWVLSAWD